MSNFLRSSLFTSLITVVLLGSATHIYASGYMNVGWLKWYERFEARNWVGSCEFFTDDHEIEYMAITHNDRNDFSEYENAEVACGYADAVIDTILTDNVDNKQWLQRSTSGRRYVGTHNFYSDVSDVKFEFLRRCCEDFTIWFADSSSNEDLFLNTAVAVNAIKNIPTAGRNSYGGTVSYSGGFYHVHTQSFGSIDYTKRTVTIDASFQGYGGTHLGRESFTMSSSEMKFDNTGFFQGNIITTHTRPVPGPTATRTFEGRAWGYVGGDGATQIALLYNQRNSHGGIDFFIGSITGSE